MVVLLTSLFILLAIVPFMQEFLIGNIRIGGYLLNQKHFLLLLWFILILVAGLRGEGHDRDYSSYVLWFSEANTAWPRFIEPSFIIISRVTNFLFKDGVGVLFFVYALLGVSTKMLAIKELSEFWVLSVLVYLSYLFILQDMTQIRAGVSTGLIMLSIKPLYEKKVTAFFGLSLLASLFHYSALLSLFLWFLNPKKLNRTLYLLFIPLAYLIYYFSIIDFDLVRKFAITTSLMNKVLAYQSEQKDYINIFNVWQLLRISLSVLFILKVEVVAKKNKYAYILTKLYVFSTCLYVILAFIPSFATRISDLFSVSDIILIPSMIYFIKPVVLAKILAVIVAFTYLFLNLFYNTLIQ